LNDTKTLVFSTCSISC